ncbi:MAG: hypothetical protein AAGI38_11170, partial [Bacteroidota bacterium]
MVWGILLGLSTTVCAQYKPHIGLTVGAATLSGSSGILLAGDPPHREYGLGAGLCFYYPLDRGHHLIAVGSFQYERSHFHLFNDIAGTESTGYFDYQFAHIQLLYNREFKKKLWGTPFKGILGIALNRGNLADPRAEPLENSVFFYRTEVRQRWPIQPEI